MKQRTKSIIHLPFSTEIAILVSGIVFSITLIPGTAAAYENSLHLYNPDFSIILHDNDTLNYRRHRLESRYDHHQSQYNGNHKWHHYYRHRPKYFHDRYRSHYNDQSYSPRLYYYYDRRTCLPPGFSFHYNHKFSCNRHKLHYYCD